MVDIIVPAYNCSKTLPRLLASIGAQTTPEKCIVTIIDDCSTEDLKSIIKDFKKYFKIKLQYIKLEKNLKWPGLVRQVGLERTNAPYVMFLDSDDFLSPRAVELANREMRSTNADVLIGHFYCENQFHQWEILDENYTTWLHGNVYKRKFLEKYTISFSKGYNEDSGFNTQCYLLSNKIGAIAEPIYYWADNEKSLTRKEDNFSVIYADDLVNNLKKAYSNILQYKQDAAVLANIGKHLSLFFFFYLQKEKEDKDKFYIEIKSFINELSQINFYDNLSIIKENFNKKIIKNNWEFSFEDFYDIFLKEE
jgi:glycosyltransferase involved in cell wall biosynthesis